MRLGYARHPFMAVKCGMENMEGAEEQEGNQCKKLLRSTASGREPRLPRSKGLAESDVLVRT